MTITQSRQSEKRAAKEDHEFNAYYALAQFHHSAYAAIRVLTDGEGYLIDPERTQRSIAKRVGKSPTWISRKLNNPGECTQKALAVFAGNYHKSIVISLVEPGHERIVSQAVKFIESRLRFVSSQSSQLHFQNNDLLEGISNNQLTINAMEYKDG